MKVNFSELLASERIRPLWGRSFTQESALDELNQLLDKNNQATKAGGAQDGPIPRGGVSGGQAGGAGSAAGPTGAVAGAPAGQSADASEVAAEKGAQESAGAGGAEARRKGASSDSEDPDFFEPPPDLADLPIRAPHLIFQDLDKAVKGDLGNRASMVRQYIEALRVRVHSVDPTGGPPLIHPMRHAAGGTIWELLSKMEDTLSGLRRVAAGR
jgi:hypothetical protein